MIEFPKKMIKFPKHIQRLLTFSSSTIFVFFFGFISFLTGFYFTELSTLFGKVQNGWERFLVISFIIGIRLVLFMFTKSAISEENQSFAIETKEFLEKKYHKKMKEMEMEYQQKIDGFIGSSLQETRRITNTITSEALPPETIKTIKNRLNQLNQRTEKFKAQYKTATTISEWLDRTVDDQPYGNRLKLLNIALNSVKIDSGVWELFRQDLLQCIHWLHDSLIKHQVCLVEERRYAAALCRGHLGAKTYVTALTAIKDSLKQEESFKDLPQKNETLDYVLGHLIEEIRKI